MDPCQCYFEKLNALVDWCVKKGSCALELERDTDHRQHLLEVSALREPLLYEGDFSRAQGLLATGIFRDFDERGRVASIVTCFELDDALARSGLQRRCERYSASQPLFEAVPELLGETRDAELVPAAKLRQKDRSPIVAVGGKFGFLDRLLAPTLVEWAITQFGGDRLFVRLDPWCVATNQPPEPLREAVVVPANPKWWQTLELHRGTDDGGHYVLQDPGPPTPECADEYCEYRVRGMRSLEMHAKRRCNGNLSMMVEELAVDRSTESIIKGRCLHLDTDAGVGQNVRGATVNHLDLAINVYFDGDGNKRLGQRLCDGKVQHATFRTHLLRAERIPLSAMLEFARLFFTSSLLMRDWFADQFGIETFAVPSSTTGGRRV